MKGSGFWVLCGLVILTWICAWVFVDYPPSLVQIRLGVNLWILRFLAGLVLGGVIILRLRKLGAISSFLILISPLTWGLIMTRPMEAMLVGVFIVVFLEKKWWLIVGILIALTVLNWGKTEIFSALNMGNVTKEVVRRISEEDSLTERVNLPINIRRLANNKLTVAGVAAWRAMIQPLDLESLFFQEINPLSRKTLVIFFWPTILFLFPAVYGLRRNTYLALFFGWWYFLITPGDYFVRYSWLMVVLAVLVGSSYQTVKHGTIRSLIFILIVYGWISHLFDFSKRPDFWLDNRPLVYRNLYLKIGDKTGNNVYVTDLMGDSKRYCQYYLGGRCDKFIFGIDSGRIFQKGDWQAGFLGEFVGRDFNNKFDNQSRMKLVELGWEMTDGFKIRDSVAYGYGDEIIMAQHE